MLCQFFFNFGPNATTFIVPGECFPTRYRSTSHGISAASGKVGSIIAQVLIGPLRVRGATKTNSSPWLNHVMEIYALFMLCGVFTTLLIPETKVSTAITLSLVAVHLTNVVVAFDSRAACWRGPRHATVRPQARQPCRQR